MVNADAERDVFVEEGGIVVIEMESAADFGPLPEGWETASTYDSSRDGAGNVDNPSGATGGDFIIWQGDQFFGNTSNGHITYKVQINEIGTYRFEWRSQVGEGDTTSEHNDTWLKIEGDAFWGQKFRSDSTVRPKGVSRAENDWPDGSTAPNGSSANGFFKIYHGTQDWNFGGFTSDHDGHLIYARFDEPGIYDITIAARSSHHVIDRMVLSHVDYSGDRQDLSLSESARTVDTRDLADPDPVDPDPVDPDPVDPDPVDPDPVDPLTATIALYDADTGAFIEQISNSEQISVSVVDGAPYALVASPSDPDAVGSVVFSYDNGKQVFTQTENNPPYAVFGDNAGDFAGETFVPGAHSVSVRMYAGRDGNGTFLGETDIDFTVTPEAVEPGVVRGYFYTDQDDDGVRDGGDQDPPAAGHRVELRQGDALVTFTT
ncbi:MAG: hypothetical protein AAFU80_20220, partial [Pseudomonadota bacterium]